jgi:Domain of unknown function (DUF4331)
VRTTLIAFASLVAAACGSSSSNPAKPTIGSTQVDRMGRAAVNTALTNPFGVTPPTQTTNQTKDAYNAVTNPADWSQFKTQIAQNLAILDGLDMVCGNQFAAGASATAGRYNTLAGVLADDRLFVNTGTGTCSTYLAVEAAFVTGGALGAGDCGGRTPTEDVVDETYSLLAIGAPSGVTDGVNQDADNPPNTTAFPFLGTPNQ